MAESIGLGSGLLSLAAFAFHSSVTLYNTIQSFQTRSKRVRDLIEELEALNRVLSPLNEMIAGSDVDLSFLDLPLLRCGKACKEFEHGLLKYSSRSSSSRTDFHDWARLRYMGDDIDGFRRLLAGYKLTISIAVTDATLRKHSVTTGSLEGYRDLIKTAIDDLQPNIEDIDTKLDNIFRQAVKESNSGTTELNFIEEESLSTRQCLQICEQLSHHTGRIQLALKRTSSFPGSFNPDTVPERVTNVVLQECKNSLTLAAARIKYLTDRLGMKSKTAINSEVKPREKWTTARKYVDICSEADELLGVEHLHGKLSVQTLNDIDTPANIDGIQSTGEEIDSITEGLSHRLSATEQAASESVNAIQNLNTADDTVSFTVSTKDFLAGNVSAKAQTLQLLGQMSDTSLKHLTHGTVHKGMDGVFVPSQIDPKKTALSDVNAEHDSLKEAISSQVKETSLVDHNDINVSSQCQNNTVEDDYIVDGSGNSSVSTESKHKTSDDCMIAGIDQGLERAATITQTQKDAQSFVDSGISISESTPSRCWNISPTEPEDEQNDKDILLQGLDDVLRVKLSTDDIASQIDLRYSPPAIAAREHLMACLSEK